MALKNLYEVFDEVDKAEKLEDKKNVLRKNDSFALRCILRANFHPDIKFVFDKLPPYKADVVPAGMGIGNVNMMVNKFYLFEVNHPRVDKNLTLERKSQLLIQMLESLEPREAELVGQVILKKFKIKGMTVKSVVDTFPDLMSM